jgi:hypothetical protein
MRMMAGEMIAGYTSRLGLQLDYFLESFSDFSAVGLDGLGRIALQQFPESSVGPRLRVDLAPLATGQCSRSPGLATLAPFRPYSHWSVSSKGWVKRSSCGQHPATAPTTLKHLPAPQTWMKGLESEASEDSAPSATTFCCFYCHA